MDSRRFTETYDLYRPTLAVDSGGVEAAAEPGTATASDQPCLLIARPGRTRPDARGLQLDYDAVLLIPGDATLRPSQRGQQPDIVAVDSRRYAVLAVWPAGGSTRYQRALLEERRA